jgi:anti-sigma factor RsiW
MNELTDTLLEAYLDEALPAEQLADVERQLRQQPELLARLSAIHARREAGLHSLGAIWRRHRLTCPARAQWGSYVLGILPAEEAAFMEFHLRETGCRWCEANLADLQRQQAESGESVVRRRTRYFETSAGYLTKRK